LLDLIDEKNKINIALLIDGENAPYNNIEHIIETISLNCRPTIRRVYGDWTNATMKNWKFVVNQYAIKPIQKFAYTFGKNSTDGALIIDAMDILHSKKVEGFCIISSDSDYTGLAKRIREEGYIMMGMGGEQTPDVFREACDQFHYFKDLNISTIETVSNLSNQFDIKNDDYVKIVDKAYRLCVKNYGTTVISLSLLGNKIIHIAKNFNTKNYGSSTLTDLVRKISKYQLLKSIQNGEGQYSIKLRKDK